MRNLAALVEKSRAEDAIDDLASEGVYDDSRKVREHDDETVELPVTRAPETTPVLDVVEQATAERRLPDLESRLRARGWSDDELARAPNSWAVVGSVVLVRFGDCPRREEVGEALLELHGEADTVLARGGISGEHREPEVTVVAGSGDTETVHTEHGTKYALDLREVMFAPGNQRERVRMGEVVEPDERVFDMFAGVGYFALPMARAGARVTAVERNPTAFQFLLENAVLNDVTGRIDAYRADCRDVDASAERVVMGYYEAHEYLDTALAALEPGGVLHAHETTPENRLWERPVERIREAAGERGREIEVLDRRRVKSHSEGVWHVVVDARVE
ncbi:class I SAM-dependent methyltransferase [Haladaptatus salinisoli]|uniref:class I SAM-dependent methyltransferase n=1 Tax=Haladaptatus salinisoli TaxID=2884876 RepID=UPI001D0B0AE7|nr:class I SAM-dependent methyltransferase family protein [Haladaptatus salinisoli]